MEIIESWENNNNKIYAIVRHSKEDQHGYKTKEYESMWMVDGELNSFGGAVGYTIADFDTLEEAQDFLLKGMALEDANPDIFLEMVVV